VGEGFFHCGAPRTATFEVLAALQSLVIKSGWFAWRMMAVAALLITAAGCGPKPLPEHGSDAERLYATRCGGCHRPFLPSSMTTAMWSEQVDAMRVKMAQAGVPPLSEAEQRQILDYLQRNAGLQ
jgi:hypothetical protein